MQCTSNIVLISTYNKNSSLFIITDGVKTHSLEYSYHLRGAIICEGFFRFGQIWNHDFVNILCMKTDITIEVGGITTAFHWAFKGLDSIMSHPVSSVWLLTGILLPTLRAGEDLHVIQLYIMNPV